MITKVELEHEDICSALLDLVAMKTGFHGDKVTLKIYPGDQMESERYEAIVEVKTSA